MKGFIPISFPARTHPIRGLIKFAAGRRTGALHKLLRSNPAETETEFTIAPTLMVSALPYCPYCPNFLEMRHPVCKLIKVCVLCVRCICFKISYLHAIARFREFYKSRLRGTSASHFSQAGFEIERSGDVLRVCADPDLRHIIRRKSQRTGKTPPSMPSPHPNSSPFRLVEQIRRADPPTVSAR
jgi:hypothetical protein